MILWTVACQTCLSMEFPRHLLSYSSRVALCWHFRLTLFQDESPLCSQTALSQAGGHCRICVGGDRPRWQWTVNSDIFNMDTQFRAGFPGGSVRKESACNARQGLGRKWQLTPAFLLEESHGQKSLVGPSPGGCKRQTQLSD